MVDISVRGAEDFYRLSKALKAAGQTELRKELTKAVKTAAKPLIPVAREAARQTFPKSGGLADREARIRFRVQTRTGSNPGVSVVAPGKYVVGKTTNQTGRFRHPVFGPGDKTRRQWRWVTQVLGNQGWFDTAMLSQAPKVRADVDRAMQDFADRLVREAGRG